MSQFHISDDNPNEIVGGAGCLCHPRGSDETRGPYIIFAPTTTDDNLSPHAVLCEHCAEAASIDQYIVDAVVVEDDSIPGSGNTDADLETTFTEPDEHLAEIPVIRI